MGAFSVKIRVVGANGLTEDVEALVDTGATLTLLPASLLWRLGVVPQENAPFRTATGAVVHMETGETSVELDGRRKTVPVVFGADGTGALLGVTTLEIFRLAVDPVEQRLTPVPGLLM